eukprot:XP_027301646.1 DNA damage-inducible transcript 3 protein [Anas platyrhynchos]
MAAEGLPVAGPAGGLPGWELEAWYQDLQEVLAAAEPTGLPAPWGAEQVSGGAGDALRGEVGQGVSVIWDWLLFFPVGGAIRDSPAVGPEGSGSVPESCELDAALTAELQELLGPHSVAGTEAVQPPDPALCRSSPTPVGTEDEQAGHKAKRKRGSGVTANKALAKNREQSNEQRVLELTARNEQLREEIRRLSAEVENTRRALINRIVNLRQT